MTKRRRTRPAPWLDTSWISVGETVVCTRRPVGEKHTGITRPDGSTAWLVSGALGKVIEPPSRGADPMRCPNHEDNPDCACGEDGPTAGMVAGRPTSAVVEWSMDDGGEPARRLLYRDDEGKDWRRATPFELPDAQWIERIDPAGPSDVGVIVEEDEDRIRVLWRSNGRRSWLDKRARGTRWRHRSKAPRE